MTDFSNGLFGPYCHFSALTKFEYRSHRDEQRHLAFGQLREPLEDFKLAAGVQRSGGFVEDKELCVAEIGAGESHLLPFASGEFDAAFKSASLMPVMAPSQALMTEGRGASFGVFAAGGRSGVCTTLIF